MSGSRTVIRHYAPLVGWIFSFIFIVFCGIFSWLAVRGGIPGLPREFAVMILGLFWLFGIAIALQVFAVPIVTIALSGHDVIVREIWLTRYRTTRFAARSVAAPTVRLLSGNEHDDPWWTCELNLPRGDRVTVAAYSDKDAIEDVRRELAAALRKAD